MFCVGCKVGNWLIGGGAAQHAELNNRMKQNNVTLLLENVK